MTGINKNKVIAVALSGGVDSAVVAAILIEKGYAVYGITLDLWSDSAAEDCGGSASGTVESAKEIADFLGIKHYVLDYKDAFRRKVVDYFVDAYTEGLTPNPCPLCNNEIKFGLLFSEVGQLGADYLATGHYARITGEAGAYLLKKGEDPVKDQSYFLYRLDQERLASIQFPLGGYQKKEIRRIAADLDLPVKNKPESQDICFIENNDYRGFLTRYTNADFQEGPIMTEEGRVVGRHKGLAFYTIGQRKGLGVAMGKPVYVTRIDTETNSLIIGENEQRRRSFVRVGSVNYVSGQLPAGSAGPMEIMVKIRSTTKEVPATLTPESDGSVSVRSHHSLLDVAPGQSAVFYQGDIVLGGGIILKE